MSREARSAIVAVCVVAGIILGAARNDPADTADAAATGEAPAGSKVIRTTERVVGVASEGAAPVPAVGSAGTRNLTGHAGKTVALTFDDGPDPRYTPQILEILDEHEVVAVFCVLGSNAARHPELVRDVSAAGHILCDHTVTHDMKLANRSEPEIDHEIGDTLASIRDAVPDAEVPFFRAPAGNFAPNVNGVAAEYDQTPLGWSVDPRDWEQPGARAIYDQVAASVHPGAIILLHDAGGDRSGTVAALSRIVEMLRAAGYEFVVPVH